MTLYVLRTSSTRVVVPVTFFWYGTWYCTWYYGNIEIPLSIYYYYCSTYYRTPSTLLLEDATVSIESTST